MSERTIDIIGHLQHYGLTPCINFFECSGVELEADQPVNVLLSETSDLRQLMKSLSDALPLSTGVPLSQPPEHLHPREELRVPCTRPALPNHHVRDWHEQA